MRRSEKTARQRLLLLTTALTVVFVAAIVRPVLSQQTAASQISRLITVQVHAGGLEGNPLGDAADQSVSVYLPPSYDSASRRRYPTLYLLHGFLGQPREWTTNGYQGMYLQNSMDQLIASGAVREMIIVVPNGRNAYGGSFYMNSVATGNWEDYIVRDLVSYVDTNYRTLARSASRGIAGHSMGGFGSIVLGMKHPDVFAAVYALSPCCMGMEADLTAKNPAWRATLKIQSREQIPAPNTIEKFYVKAFVALAAALSPNPRRRPLLADFPYQLQDGRLVRHEPAWSKWQQNMPLAMAARYTRNLLQLQAIFLDYGFTDEFSHIPITVRHFSQLLAELGVPHTVAAYQGRHGDHIRERLETVLLPDFSRTLQHQQE